MDFIGGKAKKRQVKVHGKSKKKTYNSPNNVTEMNITNNPNIRNVQRNDEEEYNDRENNIGENRYNQIEQRFNESSNRKIKNVGISKNKKTEYGAIVPVKKDKNKQKSTGKTIQKTEKNIISEKNLQEKSKPLIGSIINQIVELIGSFGSNYENKNGGGNNSFESEIDRLDNYRVKIIMSLLPFSRLFIKTNLGFEIDNTGSFLNLRGDLNRYNDFKKLMEGKNLGIGVIVSKIEEDIKFIGSPFNFIAEIELFNKTIESFIKNIEKFINNLARINDLFAVDKDKMDYIIDKFNEKYKAATSDIDLIKDKSSQLKFKMNTKKLEDNSNKNTISSIKEKLKGIDDYEEYLDNIEEKLLKIIQNKSVKADVLDILDTIKDPKKRDKILLNNFIKSVIAQKIEDYDSIENKRIFRLLYGLLREAVSKISELFSSNTEKVKSIKNQQSNKKKLQKMIALKLMNTNSSKAVINFIINFYKGHELTNSGEQIFKKMEPMLEKIAKGEKSGKELKDFGTKIFLLIHPDKSDSYFKELSNQDKNKLKSLRESFTALKNSDFKAKIANIGLKNLPKNQFVESLEGQLKNIKKNIAEKREIAEAPGRERRLRIANKAEKKQLLLKNASSNLSIKDQVLKVLAGNNDDYKGKKKHLIMQAAKTQDWFEPLQQYNKLVKGLSNNSRNKLPSYEEFIELNKNKKSNAITKVELVKKYQNFESSPNKLKNFMNKSVSEMIEEIKKVREIKKGK